MFRVSQAIEFSYGHRLLNYQGKCSHLHGHNGKVLVTLQAAAVDDRGMVVDFGEIKGIISQWIAEHLDHRMILHQHDPAVPPLRELGEPLVLLDRNPTAENIARLIADFATGRGLPVVELRLWETPRCSAAYWPGAAGADTIRMLEVNQEVRGRSVQPVKEDS